MIHLIAVSIIWGFSFVIIKGTLASLDSNFVSLVRLLLSLVIFLPFLRPAKLSLYDKLRFLGLGGMQFGLMYVAYVASYRYLPAHMIALMTTTTPLMVTIFGALAAGRFHGRFLIAAMLAVAGGAVLESPHQAPAVSARGVVLVQLSNAAFAFGQVCYRRLMASKPDLSDRHIFGLLYGGAVAVAALFCLFTTDFHQLSLDSGQWLALFYLGVVASGLGFFLWNVGARKVNEGLLAIMNNLKIPVAVVASLLILRESTNYERLASGCGLLAAALWINERSKRAV